MAGPAPTWTLAGLAEEFGLALQGDGSIELHGVGTLAGAGPGRTGALTLDVVSALAQADAVVYDALVDASILDAAEGAERHFMGKRGGRASAAQDDITALLITLARRRKRVLRLKGGDPYIFGRGGEEIALLAQHKVPFQVVPGITAASGCASYAGIPLTHRDYAQSVRFVTAHLKDGSADLPWDELVHNNQTLVFYMGLTGLNLICCELIAHGRAAETPIALVQQGTTRHQRVITGMLADLPAKVAGAGVKAPTLLIVGEVVSLHDQLGWFRPEEPSARS